MDICYLKAHELNALLKKREISCREICTAIVKRVQAVDRDINAYITFDESALFKQADEVDRYISKGGEIKDFTAIPMAIKDNFCTKGIRTTCASKMLKDYIPVYDASSIRKLKDQNFVISGKANMDEFAMGSSNENSYFGPVRNPWDLSRVSGGSSGGPAASVASGTSICSLGSDTGGSIRQPAAFCGLVGLKPTYGRVSRYGVVAFASSLDQVSPITRDMRDCANMLNAICGHDPLDSTSIDVKTEDFTGFLDQSVKKMKVGYIKDLMVNGIDGQIIETVKSVLSAFEKEGASIEEVSLPSIEYALSVYYIIAPSEASSNLSRFDGVRYGYRDMDAKTTKQMYKKSRSEGFGDEVKRRIMLGTYSLSSGYYDAYYEKAQRVRTLIINEFTAAFKKFDILIAPTTPTTAFKVGEKVNDLIKMYLSDICTIPVNLAGLPAASIPAALSDEGLPIGVQVMADKLREDNIIKAGSFIEKVSGFDSIPKVKNNSK